MLTRHERRGAIRREGSRVGGGGGAPSRPRGNPVGSRAPSSPASPPFLRPETGGGSAPNTRTLFATPDLLADPLQRIVPSTTRRSPPAAGHHMGPGPSARTPPRTRPRPAPRHRCRIQRRGRTATSRCRRATCASRAVASVAIRGPGACVQIPRSARRGAARRRFSDAGLDAWALLSSHPSQTAATVSTCSRT